MMASFRSRRFLDAVRAFSLAVAIGCFAGAAFAQQSTDRAALQNLSREFRARVVAGRTPLYYQMLSSTDPALLALNRNPDLKLMFIRETGMPAYYLLNNENAAKTVRTWDVWPAGVGGGAYSLTGSTTGSGELAIWDAAGVRTTHQEFTGRATQIDSPPTTHPHSTHVAGTMIAAGVNTAARGMSYQALLDAYDWDFDTTEMAAAAANGLQISNHSYGYAAGWEGNYWYGDIAVSSQEDYGFGYYDFTAQEFDQIEYNAPDYLICIAAGNDRNDTWGGTHFHWNGVTWVSANDVHGADFQKGGYDTISYTGNAKNILTVGAVNDIPAGYSVPGDVVQTAFSSWGPTDDGRIKPDIVANGASLTSCTDASITSYAVMSGTSMATPNASGSVNLIAHEFEQQYGKRPWSSMLKAIVINTADEAGPSVGPDYSNGWGLLNMHRAVDLLNLHGNGAGGVWERTLGAGETHEYYFKVDSPQDVRLTLAWTDPAGTPPPVSLNPSTKMLVNDLDIRITDLTSGVSTPPWVLDPTAPASAAARGDNSTDNVEQIDIAGAPAGDYYVTVTHKGALSASQDYSMVWRGMRAVQPPDYAGAGSAYIDLAAPDFPATSEMETKFEERGVFITAVHDVALSGIGMKLAVPCPTPLTVTLYEANGTTRGAFVASNTMNAGHPGEIFHYLPLSAFLEKCHDYEIVFQFNESVSWPAWSEPGGGPPTIAEPFDVGAAVRVRDGALSGAAADPELPNFVLKGAVLPQSFTDLAAGPPPLTITGGLGAAGAFVTPDRTLSLDAVSMDLGFPAFSVVRLKARVYEAAGTTRGPLVAEGYSYFNSGPSTAIALRGIAVEAVLEEGREYDIEVEFPLFSDWNYVNETGLTPFAAGPLTVLDAEELGNAASPNLAHFTVGWTEYAGGVPHDLSMPSGPNPPPFTSNQSGVDHGAYVTSMINQDLFSLGWMADIPPGAVIGVRVYQAAGTTRGPLISAGQILSSGSGMRWHDVPVAAELVAGGDYDFEIEITSVNSWGWWDDTSPGGMPFAAYGVLDVRDAEQGGNPVDVTFPRMRMNACNALATAVRGGPGAAPRFALGAPYPNPVTGVATIDFSLDRDEAVSIAVYDVAGRRVATLLDGAPRAAGPGSVSLDAKGLVSGIYFVKMQTPTKNVSRKITIVK